VPDPQDPATFERSRLQWDARSRAPHAGLVAWHRELIALRRAEPELRRGTFDDVAVAFDEDARWLVLRRASIGIACSFSDNRLPVPIGPKEIAVLASSSDASNVQPGFVELAPASALIFRQ
jgi:maltooligosyltrehalose trehalohydrolase